MASGDTRKVILKNKDNEYLIPYTEVASSSTVGRVKPDGTSTSVDANGVISVIGKQDTISDLATIRSGAAAGATAVQPSGVGNAEIEIQKNGTKVGSFTTNQSGAKKTINITVPTSASDVSALPSSTKYGASITVSLNTTDYKLTTTLKDQDGNTLGTAQIVDFPIESVVVNGSYDSTNKKIILTLQNGNTIDIPVGALISGLQSEITSSNKLDADLVDDSTSTHKFVTVSDKTTWNGKQDAIADLSDIRNNASAGASAATTIASYGDVVTHNASEFQAAGSYVPTSRTINSKALTGNITLSASDVGALPDSTVIPTVNNATLTIQKNGTTVKTFTANASTDVTANITVPTKVSDLTNDSGFISGITSSDVTTALGYTPIQYTMVITDYTA